MKPTIAIVGASGFVGQALMERLMFDERFYLRGIARHLPPKQFEQVDFRAVDLFSMQQTEAAIAGADFVVYLVHSMSPTARLDQGSFADYDLVLADNVNRAAAKNGVKHIVYLSGLMPADENLSTHLKSRDEVEKVLRSREMQVTTLRAGLIVGTAGSSSTTFLRLVGSLPVVPCPSWANNKTQPIDIINVIDALEYLLANPEKLQQERYDIGGDAVYTFREMVTIASEAIGGRRWIFPIFSLPTSALKFFVSLLTSAPRSLVDPLIESLAHNTVVDEAHRLNVPGSQAIPLRDSFARALEKGARSAIPAAYRNPGDSPIVRSVQRYVMHQRMGADAMAFAYLHWLKSFFKMFLRVEKKHNVVQFLLRGYDRPLLQLELNYLRSTKDRQLFRITGGLLAKKNEKGRLEFREILAGRYMVAAIHDFEPRLPWWLYRVTQAPMHLWVMNTFGRRLKKDRKSYEQKDQVKMSEQKRIGS